MTWTSEMSDKAIYALMDRCGMLQNMTLRGELDHLVNAVSQAFKPTWGGPDDPDVLKRKVEELQQRLNAADQRNDELVSLLRDHFGPALPTTSEGLSDLGKRAWAAVTGTSVPVVQPFTEQFIEDHLGKMPDQLRDAAKMIGIERMPPMEYDEP